MTDMLEKSKDIGLSEEQFLALYKKKLHELQEEALGMPQTELPLIHEFSPGLYLRSIFMPKDTFVIGKTHKTKHFNIIMTGKANVMIDGKIKLVQAPDIFISEAGVKKVLYILEDMNWMTTHPTNLTDLDELEKELIYSKEEEKALIEAEVKKLL